MGNLNLYTKLAWWLPTTINLAQISRHIIRQLLKAKLKRESWKQQNEYYSSSTNDSQRR